jgi:hemerythrin-like metal-binding protein
MALIKWRDEFCTGISGVDYEHRQLIEQINSVYALIECGSEKIQTDRVIDSLGDIYGSISSHFALEERMMERHGYDQYEIHQKDHERLLDDIRDITEEFEMTTELDKQQFKQRLEDWFQLHFKTHDSRLHNLANLGSQDKVSGSTMNSIINKAKKTLLHKTG